MSTSADGGMWGVAEAQQPCTDAQILTGRPRSALQTLGMDMLPPACAFALARVAIVLFAAFHGIDARVPAPWFQWDGNIYHKIALEGYELRRDPNMPSGWIGSAGWMPLYPWTARGTIVLTGMHSDVAMLLVPAVCHLITLMLVWNILLKPLADKSKWLLLVAAAFFPGMIYQHAAFPISMATLFIMLHLWLMLEGRWLWSGICGAGAAMSHPMGWILGSIGVAWGCWPLDRRSRRERFAAIAAGALSMCGILGVFLADHLSVGDWHAYLTIQSNYQHATQFPPMMLWYDLRTLIESFRFQAPSHQALLVSAVILQCLIYVGRRREQNRTEVLLCLFAALYWLFPLSVSEISVQRAHATLLPTVVLMRHLPRPTQWLATILMILVALELSERYLRGFVT